MGSWLNDGLKNPGASPRSHYLNEEISARTTFRMGYGCSWRPLAALTGLHASGLVVI